MTVIAWKGDILAADKQSTTGDTKQETIKLFTFGNCAYAFTGDIPQLHALEAWYKRGASEFDYPEIAGVKDGACPRFIVLTPHGLQVYEGGAFPTRYTDKYAAFGVGREAALGAMYCGADPVEAVKAANRHVEGCGMGVDVIKIPQVK